MARVRRVGGWLEARRILSSAPKRFQAALERATLQEAQLHKKEIVQGLTTGKPGGKSIAPLAKTTLATRRLRGMRGTKPLIARGDLRRSITVTKAAFGRVFVGVLRSARSRDGKQLANIAEVQEFGKTIVVPITPRSRRFLMVMLREAGIEPSGRQGTARGIAVVKVPARPFIRPVFQMLSKGAPERVTRRVALLLGGDLGGG